MPVCLSFLQNIENGSLKPQWIIRFKALQLSCNRIYSYKTKPIYLTQPKRILFYNTDRCISNAATKVEMRMYRVIYDAINDVSDAMKGMLAPKFREVSLGELQVRQVYKISSVGTVAGCRVTGGKITRDSKIRVVRDGIVIAEDEIASLRRFKDDVKEVAEGYECGVTLAKFSDVKEGDVYEAFRMEEYKE